MMANMSSSLLALLALLASVAPPLARSHAVPEAFPVPLPEGKDRKRKLLPGLSPYTEKSKI